MRDITELNREAGIDWAALMRKSAITALRRLRESMGVANAMPRKLGHKVPTPRVGDARTCGAEKKRGGKKRDPLGFVGHRSVSLRFETMMRA